MIGKFCFLFPHLLMFDNQNGQLARHFFCVKWLMCLRNLHRQNFYNKISVVRTAWFRRTPLGGGASLTFSNVSTASMKLHYTITLSFIGVFRLGGQFSCYLGCDRQYRFQVDPIKARCRNIIQSQKGYENCLLSLRRPCELLLSMAYGTRDF